MYTTQEYRYHDESEDRFIIVDTEGFDACGEHYTKDDAERLCKDMNENQEI